MSWIGSWVSPCSVSNSVGFRSTGAAEDGRAPTEELSCVKDVASVRPSYFIWIQFTITDNEFNYSHPFL